MNQPDLFTTEPYSGHAPFVHTETSIEAARKTDPQADRVRITAFLGFFGPCTDEELQKHLNLPGNTERPRRRELVLKGEVEAHEVGGLLVTRPTASGDHAQVWRLKK